MNVPWIQALLLWHAAASLVAFALYGIDKRQARRGGRRVPELRLFFASLLGGWPGGALAMMLFRHKTAKGTFLLKFIAAVVLWTACAAALVALAQR